MKNLPVLFLLLLCGLLEAQKPLTIEDCFAYYRFYASSDETLRFSKDGQHYLEIEDGNINEYSLADGALSRTLVSKGDLSEVGEWDEFYFNANNSRVMLRSNVEAIYRHSVLADYWIFDLNNKTLRRLHEGGRVQLAKWSPTGDAIAYVVDNNLYIKDLVSNVLAPITRDGAKNRIINGLPDWVYEEEFSPVTGDGMEALQWSPDGTRISFIRFDESAVKEIPIAWYNGDMYPGRTSFKYPKVGEANSTVSVRVYSREDGITRTVMGLEADDYVPRLNWTNDNHLVVTRLNRRQDTLELLMVIDRDLFDEEDQTIYLPVRPMLQETSPAYVDIHDNFIFLKNGQQFLWTSERNGYNHIYLNPMRPSEGAATVQLTSGNFDVTAFYGLDEVNGKYYYQTATPTPMDRQVWEGDLKGGAPRLLRSERGTWDAAFSPTFDYFTLSWSDANTPPVIALCKRGGEQVRVIADNDRIKSQRAAYGLVDKEFWQFSLADGTVLNGWMLKPKTLEPGKKYPVLFDNYGGPGSQTVVNQYDGYLGTWHQLLVQKGVIVVSVDNRGTGSRGEAFKKCTQLQLGKYETEDQIAAARYLGTLPYVDAGRIGIWGWSFGGYLSTSCILKGNDVFKMAMAVAPVTNWKWYDSAYTERFMHTSRDNEKGYEENSPVNFAERLRGSNYLICHGTADDNVHWQQTVEMINALVKANKQFETYYYPNRNHGIYGDNATIHLFTKLTSFVMDKL